MLLTHNYKHCAICNDDDFMASERITEAFDAIYCRKKILDHFYSVRYDRISMQILHIRIRITKNKIDYDIYQNYVNNTTDLNIFPQNNQNPVFSLKFDKIINYDLTDPEALVKKLSKYTVF